MAIHRILATTLLVDGGYPMLAKKRAMSPVGQNLTLVEWPLLDAKETFQSVSELAK
jgi:hypothetical protein